MARKSSSTTVQEELYPPPGELQYRDEVREELDDARLVDLDVEEQSPFLRGQKRVSARRGPLPKKAVHWIKWVAIAALLAIFGSLAGAAVYRYGEHSWRFRIESSDSIDISGTHNVTHAQVMEVLGGDIGRNIFFIPLADRKAQLERIPWVESASVMRFVPNRLTVEIHERTPVAFARVGSRIMLIDAGGTLMELPGPGKQKYSFPVLVGMNPGEPLSTRGARMKIYNDLVQQLDSDGSRYSQALSEVDISDPDDVKVEANDAAGAVLVHLGSADYLNRYRTYVTHIQGWRQQFDKLESVDLRYDKQIIVNPDMQGMPKVAQLTPAAAKAAMAAGVKSAALIHVVSTRPASTTPPGKPVPLKSAAPKTSAKPATKTAANKSGKAKHGKTVAKAPAPKASSKPVAKASPVPAKAAVVPAQTTAPPAKSAPASAQAPSANHPATDSGASIPAGKKKPSAAIAKAQDPNQGSKTVTPQDHP
jgi:cell division protein FtsQ